MIYVHIYTLCVEQYVHYINVPYFQNQHWIVKKLELLAKYKMNIKRNDTENALSSQAMSMDVWTNPKDLIFIKTTVFFHLLIMPLRSQWTKKWRNSKILLSLSRQRDRKKVFPPRKINKKLLPMANFDCGTLQLWSVFFFLFQISFIHTQTEKQHHIFNCGR